MLAQTSWHRCKRALPGIRSHQHPGKSAIDRRGTVRSSQLSREARQRHFSLR